MIPQSNPNAAEFVSCRSVIRSSVHKQHRHQVQQQRPG
uniref:Uncharacterized protein n=1 Tax=Anguilla anguilla TaxID=7936 RepID=A0A0E9VGC6_ANGAN